MHTVTVGRPLDANGRPDRPGRDRVRRASWAGELGDPVRALGGPGPAARAVAGDGRVRGRRRARHPGRGLQPTASALEGLVDRRQGADHPRPGSPPEEPTPVNPSTPGPGPGRRHPRRCSPTRTLQSAGEVTLGGRRALSLRGETPPEKLKGRPADADGPDRVPRRPRDVRTAADRPAPLHDPQRQGGLDRRPPRDVQDLRAAPADGRQPGAAEAAALISPRACGRALGARPPDAVVEGVVLEDVLASPVVAAVGEAAVRAVERRELGVERVQRGGVGDRVADRLRLGLRQRAGERLAAELAVGAGQRRRLAGRRASSGGSRGRRARSTRGRSGPRARRTRRPSRCSG